MAARNRVSNIVIENAKIIFRNFRGEETPFNRKGTRTFSVLIEDPDFAEKLRVDGWNVKLLKPRDEDDEPRFHLSVRVNFDKIPPAIYLVTRKKKTRITADTVELLDQADITNVDLAIQPSYWEVQGKSGIKAYLKTMYVTIEEDEFADKYADEEFPEE